MVICDLYHRHYAVALFNNLRQEVYRLFVQNDSAAACLSCTCC
jgi:hypothetical protein